MSLQKNNTVIWLRTSGRSFHHFGGPLQVVWPIRRFGHPTPSNNVQSCLCRPVCKIYKGSVPRTSTGFLGEKEGFVGRVFFIFAWHLKQQLNVALSFGWINCDCRPKPLWAPNRNKCGFFRTRTWLPLWLLIVPTFCALLMHDDIFWRVIVGGKLWHFGWFGLPPNGSNMIKPNIMYHETSQTVPSSEWDPTIPKQRQKVWFKTIQAVSHYSRR